MKYNSIIYDLQRYIVTAVVTHWFSYFFIFLYGLFLVPLVEKNRKVSHFGIFSLIGIVFKSHLFGINDASFVACHFKMSLLLVEEKNEQIELDLIT